MLPTKLITTASALFLGLTGFAGTFAPQEILRWLGTADTGFAPLLVQLLAAALFAMAMTNWAARGSLMGGIYNRPVVLGNLTHFLIGALALLKSGNWLFGAVYSVFAIAWAAIFFTSPVTEAAPPQ